MTNKMPEASKHMMNSYLTLRTALVLAVLFLLFLLAGCGKKEDTTTKMTTSVSILHSVGELSLSTEDDIHFTFLYNGETYHATFAEDTWKIIDSWKITDRSDMTIICRGITDAHPIPTPDHTGFRTPEDMAFEWEQHNIAYYMLPEGAKWKENAKDVDLNPEDQGKTILNFLLERSN